MSVESPSPPYVRTVLWGLLFLAGMGLIGPMLVKFFHPNEGNFPDFVQEWLSAKNYAAGMPIYEDQLVSLPRHKPGSKPDDNFLRYNAHPPAAVLAALPFAALDYRDAHLAWTLSTFALFLVAVGLAVRELGAPFRWWHLAPVAAVLIWAEPNWATINYGQLNFLLAALLTFGWAADRRGYQTWAGVAIGLAAGLKLFPGFVLLYFLFAGRWRAAAVTVLAAAVVNAVALGLFGVGAFETYTRDVLPTLTDFQRAWRNVSWNGFAQRLFDPHPAQSGTDAAGNPQLAKAVWAVGCLVIVAGVWWAGRLAKKSADPDRGWAAAVVGMLLVSPITWTHYFVLLVVPLGVLAARLPAGPLRWVGWAVLVGLCIPDQLYWKLTVSPEHRTANPGRHHIPLSPAECLKGVAVPMYLTFQLFALTLLVPRRAAVTTASAPSPDPSASPAGGPAPSPAPGP